LGRSFADTDATSFAVAETLGIAQVLSLDRRFRQIAFFEVLP